MPQGTALDIRQQCKQQCLLSTATDVAFHQGAQSTVDRPATN